MTTTLKNVSAALCVALLAACGGSSGNAALSKSFNYGAAVAPTSSEQTAASSAQTSLSSTASFSSTPDVNKGVAIVGFAETMSTLALGSSGFGVAPPGTDLRGALRSAADYSTCSTVTGNTVTFTNCSETTSGYTFTLSGTITGSASSVTWNVTATFSGTQNGGTVSVTLHESGNLTVTSTKVTGDALLDISASGSYNGQSFSVGLASAVVLDVTYQSTPTSCVTAGTVEVKRVWTQKPSGATGLNDAAVKISWTGCDTYTVAHSQ